MGCHRNEADNPVIALTIDPNRPKLNASKNNIPSFYKGDELTIVQITDTHVDLYYEVGANAVCGTVNCCRKSQVLKCCYIYQYIYHLCIIFRGHLLTHRMVLGNGVITDIVTLLLKH